jgi:hypothetical protein
MSKTKIIAHTIPYEGLYRHKDINFIIRLEYRKSTDTSYILFATVIYGTSHTGHDFFHGIPPEVYRISEAVLISNYTRLPKEEEILWNLK